MRGVAPHVASSVVASGGTDASVVHNSSAGCGLSELSPPKKWKSAAHIEATLLSPTPLRRRSSVMMRDHIPAAPQLSVEAPRLVDVAATRGRGSLSMNGRVLEMPTNVVHTPTRSFASAYAWPCSQAPRKEDTQTSIQMATKQETECTPSTSSAAVVSHDGEGGDATRHLKDVLGLRWPTSFCEVPRGERLKLTQDGACASRSSGVGRGVAFIGPMRLQEPAGAAYFEVEVCELMRSSGTIALGVCTQLPSSESLTAERASDLGKGFYLIGYDLPKLVVNGSEATKVNTKQWRPLKELAMRDVVGLLVERADMRLTVFVNGRRKVSLPMPRGGVSQEQYWPEKFWGVVDVYGTLRGVRLRQPLCEGTQSSAQMPSAMGSAVISTAPLAAPSLALASAPQVQAPPATPFAVGSVAPSLTQSLSSESVILSVGKPPPVAEVLPNVCEDPGGDILCCTQVQPTDSSFAPHESSTQAQPADCGGGPSAIEAWAAAAPAQMGRSSTAAWDTEDIGASGGKFGDTIGKHGPRPCQIPPADFVDSGIRVGAAVGSSGAAGADSACGADGDACYLASSPVGSVDSLPPPSKRLRLAAPMSRHSCGCVVHLIRHTGTVVHVPGSDFVVGRNPKFCNLTLDSPLVPNMVSRRHARIIAEDDKVMVVDNGSLNGTFVNGCRVARETLRQGDVMVIGNPAQCPPEFCFSISMPHTA
eukprot:TRINITY_DN1611_c0_g1_i1.p1 TRINITY_DN1611_c0_g1~~TRINITY_DN1611_c0_g1_i1.p1  ORF type:complete len:704 (+),score=85.84 TRINITY_DN1611_c0_g1_i1:87-2198(+)